MDTKIGQFGEQSVNQPDCIEGTCELACELCIVETTPLPGALKPTPAALEVGGSEAERAGEIGIGGGLEEGESDGESEEENAEAGVGHCKWFNSRLGFGFLCMTSQRGEDLEASVDVFVHQSKLYMEGFRSLKEGEPVEFLFRRSQKGLEALQVTGPGGDACKGQGRTPRQAGRKRGQDRCFNCGGLEHHAKQCQLPPQPKRCHACHSVGHMIAACPLRQASTVSSRSPASRMPLSGSSRSGPTSQETN
uniref:protein lin-28 homolog A-like n=1 Tax=Myxine glutinosa TaxID=7769 RepID=UPI00358EE20F